MYHIVMDDGLLQLHSDDDNAIPWLSNVMMKTLVNFNVTVNLHNA